jgi:hypothetical protein
VKRDTFISFPKEVIHRSPAYRRYVASFPCAMCGIFEFSQCAHENAGKAKAMKVCDSRSFPLCAPHWGRPGCHFLFDNYIDISREEARDLGARLSAQMRERAEAAGWRFTDTGILKP